MIVTLGSIRGSPGVTSWALLLSAAWPGDDERVVLEADPAGGVLGARYGLGVNPGVVALISGLRRSTGPVEVADAARRVAGGVWVVPGPETAEQSRPLWASTAVEVAARVAVDGRVWLVDAGRLDDTNPATGFVGPSALAVLVCGPRPEDLVQVPARVAALQARGGRVGLLVSGPCPHPTAELADFAGTGLVWRAAGGDDLAAAAGAVLGGAGRGRGRRSWAWRQALDVAAAVAVAAHTPTPPGDSGEQSAMEGVSR